MGVNSKKIQSLCFNVPKFQGEKKIKEVGFQISESIKIYLSVYDTDII